MVIKTFEPQEIRMKTPLRIAAAFLLAAALIVPATAQEKIKFTKKGLTKGAVVTVARTSAEDMTQSQSMGGQSHRHGCHCGVRQ